METSLFSVNSDTGEIVYNEEVEEVFNDGNVENGGNDFSEGVPVSDEVETSQVETSVGFGSDIVAPLGSADNPVSVLAIDNAVSGTMSSTTLDYFDRVVDGLPSDYGYIAYKTDTSDAYAGSLIYGRDYDVSGNNIVFGEGAVELALSRYYDSNRNYYLSYSESDASDSSVSLPDSGTLLYYTNLVDGRPTLGRGARPFEIAPYITVGLICVLASFVIGRIVKGRC